MIDPAIEALVAAARAIGPVSMVSVGAFDDGSLIVRIDADTDEDARALAARFGCVEAKLVGVNGREWMQHRTPRFYQESLAVGVDGPHRDTPVEALTA